MQEQEKFGGSGKKQIQRCMKRLCFVHYDEFGRYRGRNNSRRNKNKKANDHEAADGNVPKRATSSRARKSVNYTEMEDSAIISEDSDDELTPLEKKKQREKQKADGGPKPDDVDLQWKTRLSADEQENLTCAFCGRAEGGVEGKLLPNPFITSRSRDGSIRSTIFVHENCSNLCPEVFVNASGQYINLVAAYKRGKRTRCAACGEKGATIGCLNSFCKKSFHLRCAVNDGWGFKSGDGSFLCFDHRIGSPRGKKAQRKGLYCVCNTAEHESTRRHEQFFIGCDTCGEWFHPLCIGLNNKEANALDTWHCPECRESTGVFGMNIDESIIQARAALQAERNNDASKPKKRKKISVKLSSSGKKLGRPKKKVKVAVKKVMTREERLQARASKVKAAPKKQDKKKKSAKRRNPSRRSSRRLGSGTAF